MSSHEYLVEMKGIVKRFPGVLANDHVNFDLKRGEVHALLGENGAGKTTLMNILYGLYRADEGEIYIKGKRVKIRSPKDAIKLGIGMVHQNFRLIPTHTVVENIVLGLKEVGFVLNHKKLEQEIRELASSYGWSIDPSAKVWQLSAGEKQQVELLKALYRRAEILILDEPTSVLTPQETKALFNAIRRMAEEGKGVIFITHKLDEVMQVSDRVTVMRKGRVVVTKNTSDTNPAELANYMVGRPVIFTLQRKPMLPGKEVLRLKDVYAMSDKGVLALKGINLRIRKNEILGIAGVAGNGQIELAEVITGLRKVIKGKILINDVDATNKSPREIMELGVAYIPPENLRWGLVANLRVVDNLFLKAYRYPPYSNRVMINWRKIYDMADELIKKFEIVTPSKFTRTRALSGGNLQRLVLARELSGIIGGGVPDLIVAAYPTKGLDVAATEFVRKTLLRYREMGSGILLISEDLEEILMLSDRIGVIFDGRIVGEFKAEEADIERIGLLMAGAKVEAA